MCKESSFNAKLTAIKIEEDREVTVEQLLTRLAMATEVIKLMANFIENAEAGQEEYNPRPSAWAISGIFQDLFDVSHALKCACWGHERVPKH